MAMREQLERLIDEMVSKGVRYDDAQREFEKKFIAQVLAKADGNLGRAADLLGMHRNTLSRKVVEYRLKRVKEL
jgi:DNA-binding NtrC family response regulator